MMCHASRLCFLACSNQADQFSSSLSVEGSPITINPLFALVSATFNLLGSDRKPILPSELDLTQEKTITSFSLPRTLVNSLYLNTPGRSSERISRIASHHQPFSRCNYSYSIFLNLTSINYISNYLRYLMPRPCSLRPIALSFPLLPRKKCNWPFPVRPKISQELFFRFRNFVLQFT